jgi:hypothetical protein
VKIEVAMEIIEKGKRLGVEGAMLFRATARTGA